MTNIQNETLTQPKFEFIGGYLYLDLINTQIRQHGKTIDLLDNFQQWIAWLVEAKVFTNDETQKGLQNWGNSAAGTDLLRQVKDFRQLLRRMVETILEGGTLNTKPISTINELLRSRTGHLQLEANDTKFHTKFIYEVTAPIHLLVPVAEDTAHFLSNANLSRLKVCDNPDCIRFFYDGTKNHSRRWCSMDTCGNRMKVAAYHARKRDTAS